MATRGLPAWPWTREPVDDLPEPEGLLLEGCRLWGAAVAEGRSAWLALRPPFLAEDAAAAVEPFDALLRQAATLKPMAFGCPLCPNVTEDEATLLMGCALTQRGARRDAGRDPPRRRAPRRRFGAPESAGQPPFTSRVTISVPSSTLSPTAQP